MTLVARYAGLSQARGRLERPARNFPNKSHLRARSRHGQFADFNGEGLVDYLNSYYATPRPASNENIRHFFNNQLWELAACCVNSGKNCPLSGSNLLDVDFYALILKYPLQRTAVRCGDPSPIWRKNSVIY